MKKSEMAEAIMEARPYTGETEYIRGYRKLEKMNKKDLEILYNKEVKGMNKKLYVCYGSNLHLQQMSYRCPDATVYGSGVIKNYRLKFYGVASIEPQPGEDCPVGVWKISERDEKNLDRYEGFPHLYRKEEIEVVMESGETVTAMVYIMNRSGAESDPSPSYYETILSGYHSFRLPVNYLQRCLDRVMNSRPVSSGYVPLRYRYGR